MTSPMVLAKIEAHRAEFCRQRIAELHAAAHVEIRHDPVPGDTEPWFSVWVDGVEMLDNCDSADLRPYLDALAFSA
jgi:hypothetical protein